MTRVRHSVCGTRSFFVEAAQASSSKTQQELPTNNGPQEKGRQFAPTSLDKTFSCGEGLRVCPFDQRQLSPSRRLPASVHTNGTATTETRMHTTTTTTHKIDDVDLEDQPAVEAHPAAIEEESQSKNTPHAETPRQSLEIPIRHRDAATTSVAGGVAGAFFCYYYCFQYGRRSTNEATRRGVRASKLEADSLVENARGGAS